MRGALAQDRTDTGATAAPPDTCQSGRIPSRVTF